jgi:hypothetical protein
MHSEKSSSLAKREGPPFRLAAIDLVDNVNASATLMGSIVALPPPSLERSIWCSIDIRFLIE